MSSKIEPIYQLRFKNVDKIEHNLEEREAYSKACYQIGGAIAGAYTVEELTRLMTIFQAIGKLFTVVLDASGGDRSVSVEEAERALYQGLLQFILLLCEDSERLGGILQAYSQDVEQLAEMGRKLQSSKKVWTNKSS